MKYVKVEWPEIQDYMLLDCYDDDEVGFDPIKNCWYVPEDWDNRIVVDLEESEYEIIIEEYS